MDQEKIGNIIKELRKKNNLTQQNLADQLGVTYQAVSKWENGKNIPDIAILKEISKLYIKVESSNTNAATINGNNAVSYIPITYNNYFELTAHPAPLNEIISSTITVSIYRHHKPNIIKFIHIYIFNTGFTFYLCIR